VEDVEGGSERGKVTSNVAETTEARALEAVLGDGIADVLDGVVGDLELVAVGVEELAIGPLAVLADGGLLVH